MVNCLVAILSRFTPRPSNNKTSCVADLYNKSLSEEIPRQSRAKIHSRRSLNHSDCPLGWRTWVGAPRTTRASSSETGSSKYRTIRTRFTRIQTGSRNSKRIMPTSRAETGWESVAAVVVGHKSAWDPDNSNIICRDWLGTTF